MNEWRQVGSAPVDAGCLIISDPCYVLKDRTRGPDYGLDYNDAVFGPDDAEARRAFYDQGVHDNIANSGAVLVHNFGGDGTYPVYAKIDSRTGLVKSVMVVFDDDSDPT